jgi:hypothetical protein
LESLIIFTSESIKSFWNYISLAMICGAIGGVGRILLNGIYEPTKFYYTKQDLEGELIVEIRPFYSIILNTFNWKPQRALIVYGSFKEPIIGAFGAVITSIMFFGGIKLIT